VGNGELDRVADVAPEWNSSNTGARGTRGVWSTFDIVLVIAVVLLLFRKDFHPIVKILTKKSFEGFLSAGGEFLDWPVTVRRLPE
jgi:hypothetical protein